MTPVEQTQIIDLLHQREMEFVRVWESEQRIQKILLGAYSFPPPPDLPSRHKRRRPTAPKKEKASTLRRLKQPQETAYRVRYRFSGQVNESLLTDTDFLRSLLQYKGPELCILAIDAVRVQTLGRFDTVTPLWRPAPSSTE